ncbi:MAG: hypothetical protein BWY50_01748 [Spirochaetes bacterium ADurb.Bin315]|nr:MAG: hypothetical protein BWY50_01748 [Spirochaetes bacterium ADurb.Bin315]
MATGHLVALAKLPLRGDQDLHRLFDPGGKLIVVAPLEPLDVDDRSLGSVGDLQRCIPDFLRFFTEDRVEQLELGSRVALALGGDFPDEDRTGADRCADSDDSVGVKLLQHLLARIRNVAGQLLRSQLRLTDIGGEFLNVDAGEDVVFDDPFTDEHGVLVVVPVPGNKADKDVASQGEFAVLGRRSVGEHLIHFNALADFDDRLLIEAGILIGALILLHLIDIHLAFNLRGGRDDDDLIAGHVAYNARPVRFDKHAGIIGGFSFHSRSDPRGLGEHQRDRLALHVRTHQRTVGVVVLQKRNQGSGDADHLLRGDVHIPNLFGSPGGVVTAMAHRHFLIEELAILVKSGARLGDVVFFFIVGIEEAVLVGDLSVDDPSIGRLKKTVAVDSGIVRQGDDQADVRPLGGLDRTDSPIVGVVDVADLEAGAVT